MTGVVNTYYPATADANAGATSITLGTARGASTAIASGDLLLVIQMQDTVINTTNSIAYGDGSTGRGYTSASSTGLFEYVKATNGVALTGGTLNLAGAGTGGANTGLINSYDFQARTSGQGQRRFQVIRVPQYAYAVLNSGLTAAAWDGSTGGVLAIDVSQDVTLNGTISVDGLGFRGAGGRSLTGGSGANTDYMTLATNDANGGKGEGIAGTPRYMWDASTSTLIDTGDEGYPNGSSARGAPGNAGGGGTDGQPTVNDQNSGGGGGANGGNGGNGGNTWQSNLARGGLGGGKFALASITRVVMGGGGGGGTRNNDTTNPPASGGATGGGIVMIRARRITGSGTITANGSDAFNLTDKDGGGGGGGGGTVMVSALSTNFTALSVQAKGGRGGDAWNYQDPNGNPGERHGPGGGGGGGVVAYTSTPASVNVSGGQNGLTTTALEAYNATPGDIGVQITISASSIPGYDSGAECTSAPTFVELHSYSASTDGSGNVYLQWHTGYEVDNLGFNLYKDSAGKRIKLNTSLIAGSALMTGARTVRTAGQSYAWSDRDTDSKGFAQYWLEDVDLKGGVTLHGPISPVLVNQLPDVARSLQLSELKTGAPGHSQQLIDLPASEAKSAPSAGVKSSPSQSLGSQPAQTSLQTQWGIAARVGVKIMIRDKGWYQVTQPELVAAGLDPSRDPRFLRLYVNGAEVPMLINGGLNGRLEARDSIEFYAQGLDTPFTDLQAYYLVSDSQAGRRIAALNGQTGQAARSQNFQATVERKDRVIYFAALKNGETDNWFGPIIDSSTVVQTLVLPSLDANASQEATLEVSVQGVTTNSGHVVNVTVNDHTIGDMVFEGQLSQKTRFTLPAGILVAGTNTVVLQATGGEADYSILDAIRITYARRFVADADALLYSAQGGDLVPVGGFSSPAVRVFDVTDQSKITELKGRIDSAGQSYQVLVAAQESGPRTLYAITNKTYRKPAQITANQPSTWNQAQSGADLVMISHRSFISALQPLVALRQSQGLTVAVVDVEDLYDEFGYGARTPYAIRSFLARAKSVWQKTPRYVLLVGDASYDPRDYSGLGDQDFVPTKLIETLYLETACDDWFGYLSNTEFADVALGRLPVKTPDEAVKVVAKITGYERRSRSGSVVLITDHNDGYNFEAASNTLQSFIPAGRPVQKIMRSQMDDTTARQTIITAINSGPALVNYSGHGDIDLWRGDILTSADVPALTNSQNLPVVVSMTCLNGFFQSPLIDSLAESLIKADGGAVAVWASSALTEPELQTVMNQELYRQLFSSFSNPQGVMLGDAVKRAKANIGDSDIRRSWILFGDPSLKLR